MATYNPASGKQPTTQAEAIAFSNYNKAQKNTPVAYNPATQAPTTQAQALQLRDYNLAKKANTTPTSTTGSTISGANTKNTTPINVTQPNIATGNVTLQSDLISRGQAETARALAEEQKIAQAQGQTSQAQQIADYLKTSTTKANTTPTTDTNTTGTPINVNGVTADTITSQRDALANAYSNQVGELAMTNQAYSDTVDPARAELNAINAQFNEESLAGRRRKEAVLTIPGITKEQAQDKLNEIDRVNTSKLADLSIIQMAKQGQFDSAKEIADRLVQAKLEDQKNKNNALLFTYQENKELFNKAEQRQFEQNQAKRERELNAEEKNLQRISDLSIQALQDGAPASVVAKMRNASTESEAIALGGQYVGALDRKVKLANIAQSNAATNKLNREAQIEQGGGTTNIANVQAYANEFNQTGKIPSPTDLAKAGVTVQQVTQYAKQLPKQTGTIIDRNTGVASSAVSPTYLDGISALYDVRTKLARMKELDKVRVKGISGGLVSSATGSAIESEYNTLREEAIGLISKARSGLTLTATEAKRYENMIPGRFANPLGLGSSSQKKLQTADESITGTLESKINAAGLAIQGYSQVVVPQLGKSVVIGTILDIGGQPYRVLSDGTLTDIIQ